MNNRVIVIDGDRIPLTAVCENEGNVLYKFPMDFRVVGAPLMEVKRKFPNYEKDPHDSIFTDYLIEENGELILYDPDGEPVDGFELITEEEINKI